MKPKIPQKNETTKSITYLYFVELLLSPYLENVLICHTYFVTSVVHLPHSRRENPLTL
jgi:hypothetical protein